LNSKTGGVLFFLLARDEELNLSRAFFLPHRVESEHNDE